MTEKQCYTAVLEGREAPFVPAIPILMGWAAQSIGSNYGAFAADYRVLVEANLHCLEQYAMAQASVISDPYRETAGFGGRITYQVNAVPHCLPPLAESRDLALLQTPDPWTAERMLDRLRAVEELKRQLGDSHSLMGWIEGPIAEAADLRGVTPLLMDLVEEPNFVEDLMDRCVDVGIWFAREQIRLGADTVGIGDAIASQISPAMYRQLVLPRQQKLVEAIHAEGAWVRLHICGNTSHLLSDMAAVGADIVDTDWPVDLVEARQVFGTRTVLTGNLNPVTAVGQSTPERIIQDMRELYITVGKPFMAGAGCEIPMGTPPENLAALCNALHDGV